MRYEREKERESRRTCRALSREKEVRAGGGPPGTPWFEAILSRRWQDTTRPRDGPVPAFSASLLLPGIVTLCLSPGFTLSSVFLSEQCWGEEDADLSSNSSFVSYQLHTLELGSSLRPQLFSCWVESDSLQPHELQHTRFLCPTLSPGVCSDSCELGWWCHPTFSSCVAPFSSCLQSFPASVNRLFPSGGQSIGAETSASALSMNIQDWFHLGLTGLVKDWLLRKTSLPPP